jgi:hypothetical protein
MAEPQKAESAPIDLPPAVNPWAKGGKSHRNFFIEPNDATDDKPPEQPYKLKGPTADEPARAPQPSTPSPDPLWHTELDVSRLIVQWIVVLALAGACYLAWPGAAIQWAGGALRKLWALARLED